MNNQPVSVFDLAAYLFQEYKSRTGQKVSMTAMKLQKLVYYCQAWSLAWGRGPIFEEKIEAWIHGPVVPELFFRLQGKYRVWRIPAATPKNPDLLSDDQKDTANKVLQSYGHLDPALLAAYTHNEQPWRKAREIAGLGPKERGSQEIPHSDMQEYYSQLQQSSQSLAA